jgi:hypothetical protein
MSDEVINKYGPQTRWQEKNGYQAKTYKITSDIVVNFSKACKLANVSQSKQLMTMMSNFIDEVNKAYKDKNNQE